MRRVLFFEDARRLSGGLSDITLLIAVGLAGGYYNRRLGWFEFPSLSEARAFAIAVGIGVDELFELLTPPVLRRRRQ